MQLKGRKASDVVRDFLLLRVEEMKKSPESFTQEEGKALDRALRSCPSITDIDTVWVSWNYVAGKFGWLTDNELELDYRSRYCYPIKD